MDNTILLLVEDQMNNSLRVKRHKSLYGDEIIGKEFIVLDSGFVRLVDYMGSDSSILEIGKLMSDVYIEDEHSFMKFIVQKFGPSVFESISVVFHIKLPIYIMGQLVRHRTAKLNSFSGRYSQFSDSFNFPEIMRGQSSGNKQVGEGDIDKEKNDQIRSKLVEISQQTYKIYNELIDMGLCRELARTVLSQNIYTVIYWKMDMKNLLHFLRLRVANDAQKEIQDYAKVIADIVSRCFPIFWSVFGHNYIYGYAMSKKEICLIDKLEKAAMEVDCGIP